MKYAVVELKYMIKKTFIVPIIYIDDYVAHFTPTMEFYCYISTNLKDEPKLDSKYCKKFNGSPGLFKVFILAVKDSIEEAINFQELNRIKSVSMKFRQSANTDAELKAKTVKLKKKEKMVQKAAQKDASVKNSAYLANLLTDFNESDTSELSDSASCAEDNVETKSTSEAMKTTIKNTPNSDERNQMNQVSKDFKELASMDMDIEIETPNAKRSKKEITANKSGGVKMKENNAGHFAKKLAGTKNLPTTKSLAKDAINYKEQNRKRPVSGKSVKPDNIDVDSDIQKPKRKTVETLQSVVGTKVKKARILSDTKTSGTSALSEPGREPLLPKDFSELPNGEVNSKIKKPNQVKGSKTSVLSTSILSTDDKIHLAHETNIEVSGASGSVTLLSSSNDGENCKGNMDYSHFCDTSIAGYLPDEIFSDFLGTDSDSFSNLLNGETDTGNVEAINDPDIAVEHNTIVPSLDASELLQNFEPGEGLTYSVDENGTLSLISKVNESIQNTVNNLPPVTVLNKSVTPLVSNKLNCTENHTGVDSNNYKEAYLELQKKHNDLSDRHLGLEYALTLAAKAAQTTPTVQVPFTEKDGGRLYSCGVFIDARQCKFVDKSKDHNKFVNNLALAVFGRTTLKECSVTGNASKNYKYADGEGKTALDETKLKLVYDLVAARTNNDKNFNSVAVNRIIGKKIANIVGADRAKAERIIAKKNKEQQS